MTGQREMQLQFEMQVAVWPGSRELLIVTLGTVLSSSLLTYYY